jgi:hypothetical protein
MLSEMRKQLNEYQAWTLTKVNPALDRVALKNYCQLKLIGESGEYLNLVAKWVYHGKEIHSDTFRDELGDIMWYVALYAKLKNLKLGSRYKPLVNTELPTSIIDATKTFSHMFYRVRLSFNYPHYNGAAVRDDFIRTISVCSVFHGFDLFDVLQYNVAKLDKRHSDGYNQQFYKETVAHL